MGAKQDRGDESASTESCSPAGGDEPLKPQWMSVQAAAKELEVTTRTIYRFINDGKLTAYRIGRVYRIRRSDLADFLVDATLQPGDLDHLVDERRAARDQST